MSNRKTANFVTNTYINYNLRNRKLLKHFYFVVGDKMFYLFEVEDHIRVEPKHFGLPTKEAIEKQLNESYVNKVTKELGYIISVVSVKVQMME